MYSTNRFYFKFDVDFHSHETGSKSPVGTTGNAVHEHVIISSLLDTETI